MQTTHSNANRILTKMILRENKLILDPGYQTLAGFIH